LPSRLTRPIFLQNAMTGTPQYWLIETNHFHNLPGNEVCKEDSLGMRSEKNRSFICQLKKHQEVENSTIPRILAIR